jgi:hypothetical protein
MEELQHFHFQEELLLLIPLEEEQLLQMEDVEEVVQRYMEEEE